MLLFYVFLVDKFKGAVQLFIRKLSQKTKLLSATAKCFKRAAQSYQALYG